MMKAQGSSVKTTALGSGLKTVVQNHALTETARYAGPRSINVNLHYKHCLKDLSTLYPSQLCIAGLIYLCCMGQLKLSDVICEEQA